MHGHGLQDLAAAAAWLTMEKAKTIAWRVDSGLENSEFPKDPGNT